MSEVRSAVARAKAFILGGDIFDFKWAEHESLDESLEAATEWIDALVAGNPRCDFHYVLGNHDAGPLFVDRLTELQSKLPQFSWHRYFVRLEHCLFLHGDIADGDLDHDLLDERRAKHHGGAARSPVSHLMYDFAVKAQLHRLAIRVSIRERIVLQRLLNYMAQIGHDHGSGIRDVYFGHTHRELDGVEVEGVCFHNGGAAIKGLSFRVVETTLNDGPTGKRATIRVPGNSGLRLKIRGRLAHSRIVRCGGRALTLGRSDDARSPLEA